MSFDLPPESLRVTTASSADAEPRVADSAVAAFLPWYRNLVRLTPAERHFWRAVLAAAGPLVIVDVLTFPAVSSIGWPPFPNVFAAVALFGAMLAQWMFLALAHVLAPGPLVRRSLLTFGFCLAAGAAFTIGWLLSSRGDPTPERYFVGWLSIPLFFVAAESPLWLARLTRNWRFIHDDFQAYEPSALADLFGVTAWFAGAAALASLGKSALSGTDELMFWPANAAAAGAYVAAMSLIALPLLISIGKYGSNRVGGIWIAVLALSFMAFFWIMSGQGATDALWEIFGGIAFIVSLAGGVFFQLLCLRRSGWRLSTSR
jgi:hypothetical protein